MRSLALTLLITALALPGAAQTLTPGEPGEGALEDGDATGPRGGPMDTWTLESSGAPVMIDHVGRGFDAYLFVRLPDGRLLEDDDGGRGTNSRLVIPFPGMGPMEVMPTVFSSDLRGPYTLTATPFDLSPLSLGERLTERLSGEPVVFELTTPAGRAVLVDVSSDAFDPVLRSDAEDGESRTDDDGGPGRAARLLLHAEESQRVRLTVRSFGGPARGEFTVSARQLEPRERIALGGEQVIHVPTAAGETAAILLTGAPGSRLSIAMTSEDFEPLLGAVSTDGLAETHGPPTVARLDLTVPESGELYLLAGAADPAEAGEGEIHITDLGPPLLPAFTLTDLSGRTVSSADAEGEVQVIGVFTAWHPQCPQAIEAMAAIADDLGVRAVGIAVDSREAAQRFADETGLEIPILVDDGEVATQLGTLTGVGEMLSVPTVFTVDREGQIASVHIGARDFQGLREALEGLLAE